LFSFLPLRAILFKGDTKMALETDFAGDDWLSQPEDIPYSERVRRIVALGQRAQRGDVSAAATLRALADSPDFTTRLLRLMACMGNGDGAYVLQSLDSESRLLRGLAAKMLPVVCSDAEINTVLRTAAPRARVDLLRGLEKHRRRGAIDGFLEGLADEDARLPPLLPFGSPALVARRLPLAAPMLGATDWHRLARLHPPIAFEALQREAAAQTMPDARLLHQANAALPRLAETRPDAALALVRSLLRFEPPARLSWGTLAQRRPNEAADLLLAHEDGGASGLDFSSLAHRLTEERLLALASLRPQLLSSRHVFLRRLEPGVRRAVWERAGLGWRNKEGVVDAATVALLPGDLRETEARRNLALPALLSRPAQRLPYASFLPWDEAKSVVEPSLKSPEADLRAAALSALIGAARFQRARLADALTLVSARKNEQDPVRREMLSALSTLPPSRWEAEHLDSIGEIVQDALNAADLSPATASAAEGFLVTLLPFHPEWAAPWLGKLVQSRGQIYFHGLGERLTERDVRRIAPALLPVLAAWETRERETFLVQAAARFGRRFAIFDGLPEILERVAKTTRNSYVLSQILALLARHHRERFAVLVPALLAEDKSVVTLYAVYEFLHRKRQDLLTPFLGREAYKGRFSTGRTRFVLPVKRGFHRWTTTQQEIFAETLTEVTQDEGRDTPGLFTAIDQLAALSAVFPARLLALADVRMEKLAVRDAALRALARLDAGEGVRVLVDALGDVRARIAIYALRSAILEMPTERALTLLQSVPTEKVTVAKEVVRLLGELKTPEVLPLLLQMDVRPLHRDVRVALLRALWDFVEEDEAWPPLNRAATDPDPAVAGGVIRIPTDRLGPEAQSRLLLLISALLGHGDAKVRLDTLQRCDSLPLADKERTLLPPLLASLGSALPDESAAAARAVFATYATGGATDVAAIGETIARVRSDRRILSTALGALHTALLRNRSRLRPAVRTVLSALESDPLTAKNRAELAIAGLPLRSAVVFLSKMAAGDELHAEVLMAAVQAIEGSAQCALPLPASPTSEDWEDEYEAEFTAFIAPPAPTADRDAEPGLTALEEAFQGREDAHLRRLALAALTAQAAGVSGWTPELRQRLDNYRRDPRPPCRRRRAVHTSAAGRRATRPLVVRRRFCPVPAAAHAAPAPLVIFGRVQKEQNAARVLAGAHH
jgi:hypothetical protein